MSKHRTREQKSSPNYSFLISWKPDSRDSSGTFVKRQSRNHARAVSGHARTHDKADLLDKNDTFVLISRELTRTLILASFIIALELVVYLAWKWIWPWEGRWIKRCQCTALIAAQREKERMLRLWRWRTERKQPKLFVKFVAQPCSESEVNYLSILT